ncbi:PREDICTED: glutathione S-transferase T3-like [Ipomoea nil]|uniref:glutathione S-transferase T3-like n=1 Tax=Ipomoea nil TaxID=35883 RepID=UPI000901CF5E|nr:PREDICTED: glutathione S-transferase T3-like [Ipomoea nil]XP_019187114.1 PREDICTED: glutathione S-transferase T3-like [Ipomoea nil]XP_019187115.1 PREDICTED: glutathione S-transferase T3-like [Ipomoea nil]XP_019187116.1 PREDICTED: glutathione S-transferase T3-like [Ipomoea nil]
MECKELTGPANCISKMGVDPSGIPSNESRSGNIEGLGTKTPSPIQSSQSPLFLKQVRLGTLPQPCSGTGDEHSGRATWSIEEDVILAKAWIKFSEDRKKLKNSHGNATLWQLIEKYYNEYRPTGTVKRDRAKLKTHWNQARMKITAFNTSYNELLSARPDGCSDEDILLQTHEEYKATHKGIHFPYLHLWNIVRYFPMWATNGRKSKKKKTTEQGQHTSSSSAEDTVDVDEGEVHPRPVEQKDMGRKRKAPIINVDQISNTMQKQLDKLEEYNSLKARDTFVNEYQILMKDTSTMTEEQLQTHRYACETIKKSWGM